MNDAVIDTTVVALSNTEITVLKEGSNLQARIKLLRQCYEGVQRMRFNPRLRCEYEAKVTKMQNDFVRLFFELLDSPRAEFVKRSTLSRQTYDRAVNNCRWPSHDQHLLAAGLDGNSVRIYVTEDRHYACRNAIKRTFGFSIVLMSK